MASGYTLYKVCLPACCTGESWMTPGGDSTIYTNERAGRLCFITLETGQKIQWYNDNVIGGRSVSRSGKIFSVRDVGRFILISFRSVRLVQFTVQLGKTSVTVVRLPKFRFPPTPNAQNYSSQVFLKRNVKLDLTDFPNATVVSLEDLQPPISVGLSWRLRIIKQILKWGAPYSLWILA